VTKSLSTGEGGTPCQQSVGSLTLVIATVGFTNRKSVATACCRRALLDQVNDFKMSAVSTAGST
jgi:hypothetical protein